MSRTVLAFLILLSLGAGCLAAGSNPNLVIGNESPEKVAVQVTVTRDVPPEKEGIVRFNDTVEIPAGSERTFEVFTGYRTQYSVVARTHNESITFETRPICAGAETRLTITTTGGMTSHVEWCEGPSGTETSVNRTVS